MKMVEKVARALCEQSIREEPEGLEGEDLERAIPSMIEQEWSAWKSCALFALKAMLVPDDSMVAKVPNYTQAAPRFVWETMISAAIKEAEKS